MLGLLKLGLGWISGNRSYVTLIIMALAVAYLWVQLALVRIDRNAVVAAADQVCAAAGSGFIPEGTKDKDRGRACRDVVARLVAFRNETNTKTAEMLIKAMNERDSKQQTDISTAIRAATDARAAAIAMEKADASVSNDQVGAAWFDALNRSGGLRAPRR